MIDGFLPPPFSANRGNRFLIKHRQGKVVIPLTLGGDVKNLGECFDWGVSKKSVYIQFLTHKCLFWESELHKFEGIFSTMLIKYTTFRKNATKNLERNKALRSLQKYERMYPGSSSWKTSVVIDTTFVYHFVGLDLKVDTFSKKEGEKEKRGRWFWNKGLRHFCTFALGFEEKLMQTLYALLLFFAVTKKRSF